MKIKEGTYVWVFIWIGSWLIMIHNFSDFGLLWVWIYLGVGILAILLTSIRREEKKNE